VADNVCGFSFASTVATAGATLGNVTATSALVQAGIFASGNGVPPTGGINLVYNDASGGASGMSSPYLPPPASPTQPSTAPCAPAPLSPARMR
jgi:hypothetical protein